MVRQLTPIILGTANAKHQLDTIFDQDYFGKTGLIVGQRTSAADLLDYAVYFARTPTDNQDDGGKWEANSDGELLTDVNWMNEHVKQVERMLPGGLCVLGLVLVDIDLTHEKKQSVGKILKFASITQAKTNFSNVSGTRFYIVNLNKDKKTHSVSLVDVASPEPWKSSDIRFEETSADWQVVMSNFILDYSVMFSTEMEEKSFLSDRMFEMLSKFQKSLRTATVLFNSTYRSGSNGELLNPFKKKSEKGKRGKRNQATENEEEPDRKKHVFDADILLDEGDDDFEVESEESGCRLTMSGKMTVRVFLHSEATLQDAIDAVKEDIFRSLSARLDIHCDSLVGDENKVSDESVTRVVHEPPRRCLICLPDFKKDKDVFQDDAHYDREEEEENENEAADIMGKGAIMVSDFLFPGETPYESVDSVKEVFGFCPRIEAMDDDQELVVHPGQLESQNRVGLPEGIRGAPVVTESSVEELKKMRQRKCNAVAFALSGIAVLIGILVSYYSGTLSANELVMNGSSDAPPIPKRSSPPPS